MRKQTLMEQLTRINNKIDECQDKAEMNCLEIERDNVEDQLEMVDPTFWRAR